ncbi:MAG: GNAT family N-acetyltransferase [Thermoplasmatales archaeon]|jgi:ribosomal protein S18 acetylase RimI-like enzyme|nr:GNAT family N-acetyltransferase [Thermoplasmatales archaeon]
MIIRELSIKDYDALITLWNDAQLPFKPKGRDRRDKIEYKLKQGRDIFLVAEINGKLVGSVFGTHDGRKGWINRLAVTPEFQRQDIAKKLIAEVEDRFSALGIDIISCLVEDWNIKSLQVFEKLGYKKHSDMVYFSKRKDSNV